MDVRFASSKNISILTTIKLQGKTNRGHARFPYITNANTLQREIYIAHEIFLLAKRQACCQ